MNDGNRKVVLMITIFFKREDFINVYQYWNATQLVKKTLNIGCAFSGMSREKRL
jgi:hypothetical protein